MKDDELLDRIAKVAADDGKGTPNADWEAACQDGQPPDSSEEDELLRTAEELGLLRPIDAPTLDRIASDVEGMVGQEEPTNQADAPKASEGNVVPLRRKWWPVISVGLAAAAGLALWLTIPRSSGLPPTESRRWPETSPCVPMMWKKRRKNC